MNSGIKSSIKHFKNDSSVLFENNLKTKKIAKGKNGQNSPFIKLLQFSFFFINKNLENGKCFVSGSNSYIFFPTSLLLSTANFKEYEFKVKDSKIIAVSNHGIYHVIFAFTLSGFFISVVKLIF